MVEGESFCAIRWASRHSKSKALWCMIDIAEELDLAKKLNISFTHTRRAANEAADDLAKEGVR